MIFNTAGICILLIFIEMMAKNSKNLMPPHC
jgi:hypothetical protein